MQRKATLCQRTLLLILGIGILSFGVVLNIKTNLGVSPVNSIPYALSVLSGIELGNMTILVYFLLVILQMIIRKKRNEPPFRVIVQIPFGILFGKFTTVFNTMISWNPTRIPVQLCILAVAIICTALGIVITVKADVVMVPPDGLTYELSKLLKCPLGKAKTLLDIVFVLVTVLLGWSVQHKIIGIGIGTLVSAIMIGRCVQFITATGEKFQKKKV